MAAMRIVARISRRSMRSRCRDAALVACCAQLTADAALPRCVQRLVASTGRTLSTDASVSCVSLPVTGCPANRTSFGPFLLFVGPSTWPSLPDDSVTFTSGHQKFRFRPHHSPGSVSGTDSGRYLRLVLPDDCVTSCCAEVISEHCSGVAVSRSATICSSASS